MKPEALHVYRDKTLPDTPEMKRAKVQQLWYGMKEISRGFCDADNCLSGKCTVKRYGLVWLCESCFKIQAVV